MKKFLDSDIYEIINNIRNGAYEYIGSGSGRRVFDLDNGYVIKVAKNRKGIAQNYAEFQIATVDDSDLFAKIPIATDNYVYLIMEKADRINHMYDVWDYFKVHNNNELIHIEKIRTAISKYDLIKGDFFRPANWGFINNRPVIIDYGFTWHVKRKYYSMF